ncbi:MAG: DNRLRE domain-containing protein, partial [Terrimicrobiaceae bacterium]
MKSFSPSLLNSQDNPAFTSLGKFLHDPKTCCPQGSHILAVAMFFGLLCLSPPAMAQAWRYSGTGEWVAPQGYLLALDSVTVPMDAKVTKVPLQIQLRIFKAGTYKIFRKSPGALTWTYLENVEVTSAPRIWTDTGVEVGELYEYGVGSTTSAFPNLRGNVLAGIEVDQTLSRGRMAVVVAEDVPLRLPVEYAQYLEDLELDGWVVHEIVVPRAADYLANNTGTNALAAINVVAGGSSYVNDQFVALTSGSSMAFGQLKVTAGAITSVIVHYGGGGFTPGNPVAIVGNTAGTGATLSVGSLTSGTPHHVAIREALIDLSNEYPGGLKNVVLLGKVPVARSGIGYLGPDGHGNKVAAATDAYYADMDGVWTDAGNNHAQYNSSSARDLAIKNGQINTPQDNKFDPTNMSDVGGSNKRLELGVGRVDFSNDVVAEFDALKTYFEKLHRYKTASPDFQPGRLAVNRMSAPPTGDEVQSAMLRNLPGVLGMENIELINTTIANSAPTDGDTFNPMDRDVAWSKQNGPHLFYFKGSGVPDRSDGSKAVFWTGLQSNWGYWYVPNSTSDHNAMQKRLAENNMTLSYTWSIWGPQYLYHRMGMGYDAGDMFRVSISDRTSYPGNTHPLYSQSSGPLFMAHMGCPSLRLFLFEPPGDLSVYPSSGHPLLSWVASPNAQVSGYHVYRATEAGGPYERVTTEPVAGTTYTDTSINSGAWTYMVRAVRLETTGGGTFWNASLGVRQGVDLDNPPAVPAVATSSLQDAYWATPYSAKLQARGGTPLFTWSLVAGALPPGLSLAPNGVLAGEPEAAGEFLFTVRATDRFGVQTDRELSLKVYPEKPNVFFAEATQWVSLLGTTERKGAARDTGMLISGPPYNYESFLRFDVSALPDHNRIVKATLVMSADDRTNTAAYGVVQAALSRPSPAWNEATLTHATRPVDEAGFELKNASTLAMPYGTVEFDMTDYVLHVLDNDPNQKVGLRLFTKTPMAFGSEIRFTTRYASGNSRPRLIIETTDAPAIDLVSPSVSPASVRVGSSLLLQTVVTPRPERAGDLTLTWSQVSGPSPAPFGTSSQASTTAIFPVAGDYVIRLTAADGVLTTSRDVRVRVLDVPSDSAAAFGSTEGMLVRLPLDETSGATAADISLFPPGPGTLSSIGNPVTLPVWQPSEGRVGGALSFDGTGQRVAIPDSENRPLDGFQQLSVSVWVKMQAFSGQATAILAKRTTTSASTNSYTLALTSGRRLTASFNGSTAVTAGSNNTQLAVGEWHHVVMVFDGTLATQNVKLYLNGVPEIFGHLP